MMKKVIVISIVTLCLMLCSGCQGLFAGGAREVPKAPEVQITVGELTPGSTFGEVPVKVTINDEVVEHTTEWTLFSEDGLGAIADTDVIPEDFWGRLDVFYYLPAETDTTEIPINIDAPGGIYDGTGDVGNGPNGELHAWSHIVYEKGEIIPEVKITVGELVPGKTFETVPILVTVDGNTANCKIVWIQFSEDGYSEVSMDDTIPDGFWGRLDLYYYLPVGADPGNINIEIEAPGGTYDGTGEGGTDADGALEAWSHIQYEFEKKAEEPKKEDPKPQAHTHNWKENTSKSQKAKCIVDGWKFFYCTGCKETKKETIPSQGHSWNVNSPTITKEATCTAEGTKVIHCRNCDESYNDTLPAKGHSWGSPVILNGSSCTNPGTRTYTCIVCGTTEVETLPASGHSWGSFLVDNNQTHSRTCSVCGQKDTQNHNYDSKWYCGTCGYMIVN